MTDQLVNAKNLKKFFQCSYQKYYKTVSFKQIIVTVIVL